MGTHGPHLRRNHHLASAQPPPNRPISVKLGWPAYADAVRAPVAVATGAPPLHLLEVCFMLGSVLPEWDN